MNTSRSRIVWKHDLETAEIFCANDRFLRLRAESTCMTLLGRWMVGLLSLESCCGWPKMRNLVLEGLRDRKLEDRLQSTYRLSELYFGRRSGENALTASWWHGSFSRRTMASDDRLWTLLFSDDHLLQRPFTACILSTARELLGETTPNATAAWRIMSLELTVSSAGTSFTGSVVFGSHWFLFVSAFLSIYESYPASFASAFLHPFGCSSVFLACSVPCFSILLCVVCWFSTLFHNS